LDRDELAAASPAAGDAKKPSRQITGFFNRFRGGFGGVAHARNPKFDDFAAPRFYRDRLKNIRVVNRDDRPKRNPGRVTEPQTATSVDELDLAGIDPNFQAGATDRVPRLLFDHSRPLWVRDPFAFYFHAR
jgi:hypothetical protein